jgi:DNA gyrase subunit B
MAESNSIVDIRTFIRTRPGMYFGRTTSHGVVHVVNELVSNGIDLFLHQRATRVSIANDGNTINYSDDGPGLPFDLPGPGGVSLAEHYLTSYHTTPTADDHAPHIHMLGHGLGLVCVNAVSKQFGVKSWRSGRLWEQNFAEGIPVDSPHIVEQGNGKGTSICFRLDSTVFEDLLPCPRRLRRLIFEAAHIFPGVTLTLGQEVFHANNGLADLASLYYHGASPFDWHDPEPFAFNTRCEDVEIIVGAVGESTSKPLYRSWANGSRTGLHGTHVDGLRDAFRSVKWKPTVAMIHIIMCRPEFAGPTRSRLANAHVRKVVRECLKPALSRWKDNIRANR